VPASGKFQFIPWGTDSVLGDQDPFTEAKTPESVKAGTILPFRLYKLPAARERYRERLRQVLKTAWNEEELLGEVDRLEVLLKPHLHLPPEPFQDGLDRVRRFIRARRAVLEPELNGPAPKWKRPLKKSACLRKSGVFRATFDTTWQGKPASNEVTTSSADLSLVLDGSKRWFSVSGVIAGPGNDYRYRECPLLTFVGFQLWGAKLALPLLLIQPEVYKAGATLAVDGAGVTGVLLEGGLMQFEGKAPSLLIGTLELKQAGRKPGEKVSGTVQADVYRLLQ
jgi:hypothetical protein